MVDARIEGRSRVEVCEDPRAWCVRWPEERTFLVVPPGRFICGCRPSSVRVE